MEVETTSKEKMSELMVGRKVQFKVDKKEAQPTDTVLEVKNLTVISKHGNKNVLKDISFSAKRGEILCIAGIDGNGQSELVYALTGLMDLSHASGKIILNSEDITNESIRERSMDGMSHIPEDRHKHGLVLDYSLAYNLVLQKYFTKRFQKNGFLKMNRY